MPRLFTALEIPSSVAQSLARLRGGLNGARWIDAEYYHITLRFIGDVDERVAHDVAHALYAIRRPPFTVALDELTSFGGDKPRAIVVRARPEPVLMELQAEQERLLRRLGAPPEPRKYTPHVTLILAALSSWTLAGACGSPRRSARARDLSPRLRR